MGFVFFLFIYLWSVYAENDPCGDFYKFACTENNQGKNDGTGAIREAYQLLRQLQATRETEGPQVERDFDELLSRRPDLQKKISDDAGCWFNRTTNCDNYNIGVAELRNYFAETYYPRGRSAKQSENILPYSTFSFFKNDAEVNGLLRAAQTRINQRLVPIERRNYVKDTLFPQVLASMEKVLRGLPDSPQKQKILARLQRVMVATEVCNGLGSILEPNAFFQPDKGTDGKVLMCLSIMYQTDSLFSIAFVMAHELAHSIDPCRFESTDTFSGLNQCLSRARSMGLPEWAEEAQCEAFCDWMATEVIAQLVQTPGHALNRNSTEVAIGVANQIPLCDSSSYRHPRTQISTHPRTRDRVEMGVSHPVIRQRMGCTNNGQQAYCPLNGLPPHSENPPPLGPNGVAQ